MIFQKKNRAETWVWFWQEIIKMDSSQNAYDFEDPEILRDDES